MDCDGGWSSRVRSFSYSSQDDAREGQGRGYGYMTGGGGMARQTGTKNRGQIGAQTSRLCN